jgi:hypothetical protein
MLNEPMPLSFDANDKMASGHPLRFSNEARLWTQEKQALVGKPLQLNAAPKR